MKTVIAFAALIAISTPALAGGDTNAKNMAGGVASFVSSGGNGGWGNVGSRLTGGQVPKSKT
jgi:hypothetical protein